MIVSQIIGHNYLKPQENEKVPILVIDFKKMYACWLPGLRKTLYFENKPETEELKRIREVILLEVYTGTDLKNIIELTPEDFEQFETVYDLYSTYGGEIKYSYQKEGRRKKHLFHFKPKTFNIKSDLRRYKLEDIIKP